MGRLIDLFMGRDHPEERADTYTDVLVGLLVSQAGGRTVKATATAALEAAAGLVGRAFAAAEVEAPEPIRSALCPLTRSLIGRALIRSGEAVLWADMTRGLALRAVSDHDITGSYNPDTWLYRLNLPGPSVTHTTHHARAADVLHFRYQIDPERPWRGVGPVESAALAGRLSAELVNALADETAGTRGALLPIPVDGEDPTVAKLKQDLKVLSGNLAVVESQTTGNWTADQRPPPRNGGWTPQRIGANPPAPLVELQGMATREIWAAVGFPNALFSASDGSASREAWRQVLHGVLAPLGTLVAEEIADKTGVAVELTWSEIRASDITGRSRAFQSLVQAGASFESAAVVAGLELEAGPTPTRETVAQT